MQHTHYAYRGDQLNHFSLYEYASIVLIVKKPKKKNSLTNEEEITEHLTEETCVDEAPAKRGRICNQTFDFHPNHPLFLSHHQQLRSKTKVPILANPCPRIPPSKPTYRTEEWERAARLFSHYILTLHRPWSQEDGTLPGSLSWLELCRFMKKVEFGNDRCGPTPGDTVRRRWIELISHGM